MKAVHCSGRHSASMFSVFSLFKQGKLKHSKPRTRVSVFNKFYPLIDKRAYQGSGRAGYTTEQI